MVSLAIIVFNDPVYTIIFGTLYVLRSPIILKACSTLIILGQYNEVNDTLDT